MHTIENDIATLKRSNVELRSLTSPDRYGQGFSMPL